MRGRESEPWKVHSPRVGREVFEVRRTSSPSPGGTFGLSLGVAVDEEAAEKEEAPVAVEAVEEESGDSRGDLLFMMATEFRSSPKTVSGRMRSS